MEFIHITLPLPVSSPHLLSPRFIHTFIQLQRNNVYICVIGHSHYYFLFAFCLHFFSAFLLLLFLLSNNKYFIIYLWFFYICRCYHSCCTKARKEFTIFYFSVLNCTWEEWSSPPSENMLFVHVIPLLYTHSDVRMAWDMNKWGKKMKL